MEATFEWDAVKATRNRRRHRVSFEEAVTAFSDPFSITKADPAVDDLRYILIGLSGRGRHLIVSHAERDSTIRIISAREATRHEREQYEEGAR